MKNTDRVKNAKVAKVNSGSTNVVLVVVFAIIILVIVLVVVGLYVYDKNRPVYNISYGGELKKFTSYDELAVFINNSDYQSGEYYYGSGSMMKGLAQNGVAMMAEDSSRPSAAVGVGGTATDYSHTNIQVEGVDEADILKNDGKYIYTLSNDQQKILIIDAYPANEMKIVGEVSFNKSISSFYLNGDKLVVFSPGYESTPILYGNGAQGEIASKTISIECFRYPCGGYGQQKTFTNVFVYDISDHSNPKLSQNISVEGNYVDSRMIGDYVYLISQKYVYNGDVEPPLYRVNGVETKVAADSIYYFDYMDYSHVFTLISAIKIDNGDFNTQVYLTGSTGILYVSQDNIYLTHQKTFNYRDYNREMINEVYMKLLPSTEKSEVQKVLDSVGENGSIDYVSMNEIQKIATDYSNSLNGKEKADFDKQLMTELDSFGKILAKKQDMTEVYKIGIDKDKIEYKSNGEVSGYILNQFSMDEYNGNFRIATTSGNNWQTETSNNLYVLDENLKVIGSVENLAPGETIYSARFMGDRAYMVTFKSVDPLFVLDLSNPQDPKMVGYLKVTGYSDYLQFYDETHLIGIGKEVNESIDADKVHGNNAVYYTAIQGVKVSLFDVSDVANPTEVGKVVIGERGTDSEALYNHKAVLFSKEKNLLVLPISLVENQSKDSYTPNWKGAYVLNINLNDISVKGRITHTEEYTGTKYGPAKDMPVGTNRTDANGIVWTKYSMGSYDRGGYYYNSGTWRGPAQFSSVRMDYDIDNFPGGINYDLNMIYDYKDQISRSLYMDDVLYTISQARIKANSLGDLGELNKLDLPYEEQSYYYDYPVPMAAV